MMNQRIWLAPGLALLIMAFAIGLLSARAGAQATLYSAPIDYCYLSPALIQHPPAQLHLPTLVAFTSPLPAGIYYGTGSTAFNQQRELTGYAVYVQADPQRCHQALSCTEAYVEATAIDSASPSIQEQYSLFYSPVEMSRFRATAGHDPFSYQLSNGQTVMVLPWTEAGAGMGYEKAIWDECDELNLCYRYVIGLKGGAPDALITMLGSAFNGNSKRASESGTGGIVSGDWNQLIEFTDPKSYEQR